MKRAALSTREGRYIFTGCILLYLLSFPPVQSQDNKNIREQAEIIVHSIQKPDFKNKSYNIRDFGATEEKDKPSTPAINEAIKTCSENGGGTVIIPAGTFLTGAIQLKSNVNILLEEGAILKFSTFPEDYLPAVLTRWEGVDCYNYSPLIYGYKLTNVAITGMGILDGQADDEHWWMWKGRSASGNADPLRNQSNPNSRKRLMELNEKEIPVEQRMFGDNHYLRPPFIQLYECSNIFIEGITLKNSPFWIIHPLLSENIIVRGVTFNSSGPNNDGCNPESSKNILIENCTFNTGDDCIAIKSGRNQDGRRWNIPSENIVIRNCEMKDGHGGVAIGSEVSGGCRNVFVYDCKMSSPNLERAFRIKTNALRGGVVENLYFIDISIGQVREAIFEIECTYETKSEEGNHPPLVRNIVLENITSEKSKYPYYLRGLKSKECIKDIYLTNINLNGVEKESPVTGVSNLVLTEVKINGKKYESE